MSVNFLNPNVGPADVKPVPDRVGVVGLTGGIVYDYKYILYNQVHAIKNIYNFGNISNDSYLNLEIWNANEYKDITINDISYSSLSGVEVLNRDLTSVNYPVDIKKIESSLFSIHASTDGDSSNDGFIIVNVDDKDILIAVSLSRSILFDYEINFREKVKETYVYNTFVSQSLNNTEQRRPRITIPRVRYEYYYTLTDKERREIDGFLYSKNSNLSVPIYMQKRNVQSIVNDIIKVDIVNTCIQVGQDVLIKDQYSKEIIKVSEIIDNNTIRLRSNLSNIYTNATLIPCFSGKLPASNTRMQRTKNMSEYSLLIDKNVDEINTLLTNNDSQQFNKYKDLYILEEQNSGIDLTTLYEKNIIVNDNGYSRKDESMYNDVATVSFNFDNYAVGKDEISKVKNLFKNQRGMLNDLYSRSFTNNIKVVEKINAGDIIITVEDDNLTEFYKNSKIKHLYLKYNNNIEKYFEIIDISKIEGTDKEAIFLNQGLGVDVEVNDVISSDFVYLGRLNDDSLVLNYDNLTVSSYSLSFKKYNDIE